MTVHWTRTALRQLSAVYDYIAQHSERYARRMVDRITRRSEEIGRFPHLGWAVAEYDCDEIREVLERPYRIIYRIRADRIDVIAVIHAARQLPERL